MKKNSSFHTNCCSSLWGRKGCTISNAKNVGVIDVLQSAFIYVKEARRVWQFLVSGYRWCWRVGRADVQHLVLYVKYQKNIRILHAHQIMHLSKKRKGWGQSYLFVSYILFPLCCMMGPQYPSISDLSPTICHHYFHIHHWFSHPSPCHHLSHTSCMSLPIAQQHPLGHLWLLETEVLKPVLCRFCVLLIFATNSVSLATKSNGYAKMPRVDPTLEIKLKLLLISKLPNKQALKDMNMEYW